MTKSISFPNCWTKRNGPLYQRLLHDNPLETISGYQAAWPSVIHWQSRVLRHCLSMLYDHRNQLYQVTTPINPITMVGNQVLSEGAHPSITQRPRVLSSTLSLCCRTYTSSSSLSLRAVKINAFLSAHCRCFTRTWFLFSNHRSCFSTSQQDRLECSLSMHPRLGPETESESLGW